MIKFQAVNISTAYWGRRCLALGALTGFCAWRAVAADWTEYRGPENNGISSEKIAATFPVGGPKVKWKVPSANGFSSFVIAGGRCFTQELRSVENTDQEVLVARDTETGAEKWFKPLGTLKLNEGGQSGTKENSGGDGPRSTPAADANHVWTFSGRLVLQCFDAKTGTEQWKRDLVKEHAGAIPRWMNAQSPVIDGDLLFVAGGGAGESLLALNKKDGSVAWKAFDEKATHATCVPATILGERQVIYFLQSGLVSVAPKTGKELWRYPFKWNVSTAASPVVDGDIVYCSAGYGVGIGAARISRPDGGWKATEIYRFAGEKALANHWSTPVLYQGHLYGMFQFKEYGSGPVKCVEVATGKVKWDKPGFGPGHVILAGDKVVALSDAGELVVIAANPEKYTELSRATVLEGKCWTTPSLSGGRLYVRSTKEAACLDVSPQRASR